MTTFEQLNDLPVEVITRLRYIDAKESYERTTDEASVLANYDGFLTNKIVLKDSNEDIIIAQGKTVPTGYSGFAKSALFIKTDATDGAKGLYENVGTTTVASWNLIGEIATAEIGDLQVTTAKLAEGAVTSAKLASVIALLGKTFSLPTETPVNAVASTGTLALTGVITPGVHAESVVTVDTIANGNEIVIGDITYTAVDALSTDPAVAYEVLIGAGDAEFLDNLKSAINGTAGEGTTYGTGTVAHPIVVATDNGATTQKVVARLVGTAANATGTTGTATRVTWSDTTLGGGTGTSEPGVAPETVTIDDRTYSFVTALSETSGADAVADQVLFGADSAAALDNLKLAINNGATEGTNYSTGTVVHATVEATTNSNTEQTVAAKVKGTSGDAIATTDDLANGAWGAAVLENGVDGTVGVQWETAVDASYLYIAIATNTIADANWRRVDLGSAY